MSRQIDQGMVPGGGFAPTPPAETPPPTGESVSLDQLVASVRELYLETSAQFRDIGELAFMELELAIKALQWGLAALLLLTTCSVLTFVFLLVAIFLAFAQSGVSPTLVLFCCGGICAIAAGVLFFFLRSLTKKMMFSHLRNYLTRPHSESK